MDLFSEKGKNVVIRYVCVYDEHPLAGRDIQYQAPNSQSRYTTPFDEIKSNVQYYNTLGYYLQYPGNTTYNNIKMAKTCNSG